MHSIEPSVIFATIALFLIANLAVGYWASHKKVESFDDYALAGRNLPTGVLVMTLVGTFLSTGHYAAAGWIAKMGMLHFLQVFMIVFSFLLIGTFIAPNLVYFREARTTGDLMNTFFGSLAQIATGLIGMAFSVGMLSGQLKGVAHISKEVWGISSEGTVLIVGFTVVVYSTLGGMKAVSYTDVVQMVTVLFGSIWIFSIGMGKVGGIQGLFKKLGPSHASFFKHPKFLSYLGTMCVSFVVPMFAFCPPIVQRMLVTDDKKKVRYMWYLGAFLIALILGINLLISGVGLVSGVDVDAKDVDSVTNLLLNTVRYLSSTQWMLNLFALMVLAVGISTIDSFLHAIGILMVQDLILPIRSFLGMSAWDDKKKTYWAKVSIAIMGSCMLIIGYVTGASIQFIVMMNVIRLFAPIMVLPLILGILGVKTDTVSWLGFIVGYLISFFALSWYIGTIYWWSQGVAFGYYQAYISLSATLMYWLVHLFQNKGIATVRRGDLTVSERLWIPSWQGVKVWIKGLVTVPLRLPMMASRKMVTSPVQSLNFSMFMAGWYVVSLMNGEKGETIFWMNVMRGIGITLCVGLMLEGSWLRVLKPYFSLYWFLTLGYCLPFSGSIIFLHAHEKSLNAGLWAASLALLALLVDSETFFVLTILGVGTAFIGRCLFWGALPREIWQNESLITLLVICVLFLGLLIFSRRKESYAEKRLECNRIASGMLAHDLRTTVHMLCGAGMALKNAFKEKKVTKGVQGKENYYLSRDYAEFLQAFAQEMVKEASFARKDINNFLDFVKGQILGHFERKEISMCTAIEEGIERVSNQISKKVRLTCPQDFKAKTLPGVFPNAISNLLKNASMHGKATIIDINIDAKKRTVTVHDNGKGIPPDILPSIFDLHYTSATNKNHSGTGLAFIKMVIQISGGDVYCHSTYGKKESSTSFIIDFS
ncbi:MAG: ATP-binding protein [Bacteroidota bacterium]